MGRARSRIVWAVGLAVAGGLVAFAGERPAVEYDLPPQLQGPRCVAHSLNTPGQGFHISGSGFHISGSAGGLVHGPIEFEDPQVGQRVQLTPLALSDVLVEVGEPVTRPFLRDLAAAMERDVLIVVADDFAGERFVLPAELDHANASTATIGAIEQLVAAGELSHGALVLHHLNAAIAATGAFDLSWTDGQVTAWVGPSSSFHLVVAGLDMNAHSQRTELIDSAAVVSALQGGVSELFDRLQDEFPQLAGVVVNMSWVFLPCETLEEFLSDRPAFATWEAYLGHVGIDLASTAIEDVLAAISGEPDDPADAQLAELFDGREVALPAPGGLVGAAGNFSMPYQMFPAAWRMVVGVAVEKVDRLVPGRYSNRGDVTVAGEWTSFQPLDGSGSLGAVTPLSYAGTSYAAPLVSLYLALDTASQSPSCQQQNPDPPPLTKATTDPSTPADARLVEAIDGC